MKVEMIKLAGCKSTHKLVMLVQLQLSLNKHSFVRQHTIHSLSCLVFGSEQDNHKSNTHDSSQLKQQAKDLKAAWDAGGWC